MFTVWIRPPKKKVHSHLGQTRIDAPDTDFVSIPVGETWWTEVTETRWWNALLKWGIEWIEAFQFNISTEKKLFQFMFKGKMDFQSGLL